MRYIATFPAGCFPVIAKQLKKMPLETLAIMEHDESSVTFSSSLSKEHLIEMRFFTNVFIFIDDIPPSGFISGEVFRLYALIEGETQAVPAGERRRYESRIARRFGLLPETSARAVDFVIVQRRSSEPVVTLRLSRAKHKRMARSAGALRPELAHIVLLVAGCRAKDTLLDPFAGTGAIGKEARMGFGLRKVLLFDAQPRGEGITVGDARNLPIPAASIDRIVTDPPWGYFDQGQPIDQLYASFVTEAARLLRAHGVMVILTTAESERFFVEATDFTVVQRLPVLVSGKKAVIIKLRKK